MKKSLATLGPPRRELRPGMPPPNRKSSPKTSSSASVQKNLQHTREHTEKPVSTTYQQKYRNKNLNAIPTPLLVTISGLNVLDISYNRLNDSQIQLVMNSCTKLLSLCIQGNINTIIPAAIWKLKELANFKHDWLKFANYGTDSEENYQGEEKLKKIKTYVQKPDMVVKVNRIVGLDFEVYCREIGHITLDFALMEKVEKSDCSSISKQSMCKIIKQVQNTKNKAKPKMKPIMEKDEFLACTAVCGFDNNRHRREQKPGSVIHKREAQSTKEQSYETETDAGSKNIKISDIRDISSLTQSTDLRSERELSYSAPGMVFHQLLATFDSNPSAPSQIDALLLKGYNPNQYDSNGLSPYHVCLIQNQKKGFEYLINISGNNPGFFDLQMASQKQCRSILHYSVFLKNYFATKLLIQFGLPVDRRDSSGARIMHLVDQNIEFLLLLKKLLKKTTAAARSQGVLTTIQTKKKYVKLPQRAKDESKFRIMYSKNEKILQMYESAVGIPVQIKNP